MSHAIVIGATAPNMIERYIEQSAKSNGLHVELVAEVHSNPKLRISDITNKYLPNGQWITFLQSDGELDLADLKEHVGIKRRSGFFKQLRFTPTHPKEFVSQARVILGLVIPPGRVRIHEKGRHQSRPFRLS